MTKKLICVVLAAFVITSCANNNTASTNTQQPDSTSNQKIKDMKHTISIIEIPTADFARASKFYEAILDIKLEVVEMEGIKMGLFPQTGDGISVQLIHGGDYKPSTDGTVVYLNGGNDLQLIADKITANGGKIVIPKTTIGPEMGYYGIFMDSEGNKLGLYSVN